MKQQLSSTLPQGSIPVFDGEVFEYKSFIHFFQNMIERKTDNHRGRLQFLIQYTKGQAQQLDKSCEYMAPDRGYQRAMQLLKENFGNEYKISRAYLEKALSWSQIKSQDAKSLCHVPTEQLQCNGRIVIHGGTGHRIHHEKHCCETAIQAQGKMA